MDKRTQTSFIYYPTEVIKDEVVIVFLRRLDILYNLCPDDKAVKLLEISMDLQRRQGRNKHLYFQVKK
jgi:tricorn protease-like protein